MKAAVLGFAALVSLTLATEQSTVAAEKFKRHPNGIAGQYIVVLNGDQAESDEKANKLLKKFGGKLKHVYKSAIGGFAAELDESTALKMSDEPEVEYIEQDQPVKAIAVQSNPVWGLDRIDQRDRSLNYAYNYSATGTGVKVYVIDTGIRPSHADFGGRASVAYDAIGDGRNGIDCNGHGTHVAGTIGGATYGVAKAARLYGIRVLDCSGNGATSGVIAGVNWVTANKSGPAVANMSLGGGISSSLDQAVRNSIAAGVTYAIAAGNDNLDACNSSPARVSTALTVGASNSSDARASFSNWGTCLDLFAPGEGIRSAWHTSNTATANLNGTSMAAPHVAGVAALYLETNPTATPAAVESVIKSGGSASKLSGIGTGSPNVLLYSQLTTVTPTPSPTPTPTPTAPAAPCTSCTAYAGSLSGTGASSYQPSGTYYYSSVSGTHSGWLRSTATGDFDLYLQKWNGRSWVTVASSHGSTSSEQIAYSGTAGYYIYRVYSYSGSGSYSFWLKKP